MMKTSKFRATKREDLARGKELNSSAAKNV